MGQRTASLNELLSSSFDYHMSNVYTSIPGIIVSVVDIATQTVNVKPSINMRNVEGDESFERPTTLNVQYHLPISSMGGLSFPVAVGDPVMLIFSMRGLDSWKASNGGLVSPSDLRKFDPNDCIAIPGITPPGVSKNLPSSRSNGHDPSDVVLVHNMGSGNEVEIRLKRDGNLIINSPKNITLNATENVEVNCVEATISASSGVTHETPITTLTGNLVVQGTMSVNGNGGGGTSNINGNFNIVGSTLTHNGISVGSTHSHGGVDPGTGTSGPPI